MAWSSSDPAVATVDNEGHVTAVAPGTAAVTVTASQGTRTYTASCEFTVIEGVTDLTLNKSSLKLAVEGTAVLKATVQPEQFEGQVKWSSSDTKIAKVSGKGKVTALKAGTCTITCKATDGSGMEASCEVTVYVPVTKLKPSTTKQIVISETKTQKVSVKVSPANATDKSVTWSSSNKKIATVDSKGKITGVKKGSCTITAKANDGSGVVAKFKVLVEPIDPIKITKMKTWWWVRGLEALLSRENLSCQPVIVE